MRGPASSTSVRSPFSVNSLAAHPPVMPEPTTIASYSLDGDGAIVTSRDDRYFQHFRHHDLGGEIPVDHERFQLRECLLRTPVTTDVILLLHALLCIEQTQQRNLFVFL